MNTPKCTFYRMTPQAKKPVEADKSAAGFLPTRAFRYCEAARTASSLGWYLFPPVEFSLMTDGNTTFWKAEDLDWAPLDTIKLPGTDAHFDAHCPDALKGFSMTFLGSAENGMVQIWTGLGLRTDPGWGVLVRKPPNVPQRHQIEQFEGYIRTDVWFGPLITNIRLLKTDFEYRFSEDWPIAFAQPLPAALAERRVLADTHYVNDLEDMSDEDWSALGDTVKNRLDAGSERAKYAKGVRRAAPTETKPVDAAL